MSPAAVDIGSHSSSKPRPSSRQNPKPTVTSFAQTNHPQTPQQSVDSSSSFSSNFGNAGDFNFGSGLASQSGSRPVSGAPGRSRPRLVKVRKQLHGGARTRLSDVGSGFNPFMQPTNSAAPVSRNGCGATTTSSNSASISTGFVECLNRVDVNNENNATFVFGAHDGNDVDLDSGKRGFAKNVEVDHGKKSFSQFDNTHSEKSDLGENVGKFDSDNTVGINAEFEAECGKFGFVCSANGSDAGVKLNVQKNESSDLGTKLHGVVGGSTFVFGASQSDSAPDFNLQRRESDDNPANLVSDDSKKTNVKGETDSKHAKATTVDLNANSSDSWNKDCDNDLFVFGSSRNKSYHFHECATAECNGSKVVFENENNVASASSSNSVFELQGDMKKLNINNSENVVGAETAEDFHKEVFSETIYVFGSSMSTEASNFSNKTSENNSHDQTSKAGPAAAAEQTFQDNSNFSKAGVDKSSEHFSQGHLKDDTKLSAAAAQSFSSFGSGSQPDCGSFEVPSMFGMGRNGESCSASTPDGSGVSFTDFKTPQWDPSSFKENLFPELSRKMEFSAKSSIIKNQRPKKTKGKLKQSCLRKHGSKQDCMQNESSSQANPNASECYSPMDFSPYGESTLADQFPRDVAESSEALGLDSNFVSSSLHSSISADCKDEDMTSTEKAFDINKDGDECSVPKAESCGYGYERFVGGDCTSKGAVSGAETACFSGAAISAAENGNDLNRGGQDNDHTTKCKFVSGAEDERNFTFSACSSSPSIHGRSSVRKRELRKKSRVKTGNASFIITPSPDIKVGSTSVRFSPCASTSLFNPAQGQQADKSSCQSKGGNDQGACEQLKQASNSFAAIWEACEMWRLRGNQAYRNDNLSKAEDFYTQGINCVPSNVTSGCSIKPLVLCYSNRAATRISLGRMREALSDCLMTAALDPEFLKIYVRAANCHLVLGEIENAVQYFNKCLGSVAYVCLDRRVTIDAADGLQKAQKVGELTNRAATLLEQKTTDAASNALDIIDQALSISSCSEKLIEMKAEALCMLRRYGEAVQLCEQTLSVAEKNFTKVDTDNQTAYCSGCYSQAKLWRWFLIAKSYFYMGRLEGALDLLQKLEQEGSTTEKYRSDTLESSISLAVTIRELLHLKNAGNDAVRSGRYTEAVELYTVALSSNLESRPFVAICFCNRAAAHQALGQIADAIADCSLAMALDGNYTKAVSRRGTLHEMIRDYRQAASDLQRLISILESQSDEKAKQSGTPGRSATNTKELKQAQHQLLSVQEEAKKEIPLDLYLILGVKPSDSVSDIKKAYRKAALRHHPDKAGQFLARSESGDEGRIWKEIADEVHKDADRLFKMIGEAYAVLSDTTKRSEYDLEEEMRKSLKESNQGSTCRRSSDAYGYHPFERNTSSRRNWRGNWKAHGNSYSYSRW